LDVSRVDRRDLTSSPPQVGSRNGAVLSEPVSIPRLVKRSMRISRTTLSLLTSSKGLCDLSNWQRFQTFPRPYSTCSCRISLHLQVYLPSQVLQTNGRLCHLVLASLCCQKIVNSRVPLLPRRYSGSSLIRTLPPPSRLSVHFPLSTVIKPTLLRKFLSGTRRASPVARHVLVTVLSLPPRRSD
jgi:hypothetical protein